jgi:hypothetical protein
MNGQRDKFQMSEQDVWTVKRVNKRSTGSRSTQGWRSEDNVKLHNRGSRE